MTTTCMIYIYCDLLQGGQTYTVEKVTPTIVTEGEKAAQAKDEESTGVEKVRFSHFFLIFMRRWLHRYFLLLLV